MCMYMQPCTHLWW